MAEDTQQWNDLTQLYASFSETELRNLAGTLGDLTEVAQQALKSEFARRGLALPAQDGATQHGDDLALRAIAANAPPESVFEFADLEDALLAQSLLRSAGIGSVVPTSEIGAVDTPRLIVGPADASAAQSILSRPNALGTISAEDAVFTEPVCPQCGTPDPLLEGVDPTNQWRCESCGHSWIDTELA
jgi:hypothetical protein